MVVHECGHPLEVALAAEGLPTLPFPGEDAVEDELGGDRGMIQAWQEERPLAAHPGVTDHEVLDRRPLGVAEVERAGHVGRWLDDRERRQARVRRRACAVGSEHVRGDPVLVDRAFDVSRRVGLG